MELHPPSLHLGGLLDRRAAALLASGVLVAAGMALYHWDTAIGVFFTPFTLLVTFAVIFCAAIVITTLCAFFSINRFLRLRGNKVQLI